MNNNLVLFGLFIGIGVADYFILRKSNDDLKKDILKRAAMDMQEQIKFSSVLDRMTRQELSDVDKFLSFGWKENTPKRITDKIDPALKQRLIAISNKYKIFT